MKVVSSLICDGFFTLSTHNLADCILKFLEFEYHGDKCWMHRFLHVIQCACGLWSNCVCRHAPKDSTLFHRHNRAISHKKNSSQQGTLCCIVKVQFVTYLMVHVLRFNELRYLNIIEVLLRFCFNLDKHSYLCGWRWMAHAYNGKLPGLKVTFKFWVIF